MSHTIIEFHNKFARFNNADLAVAVLLLIHYFQDSRPNFAKAFENWGQSFRVLSIANLEMDEYLQNDNQQVEFLQMLEKMILNLQIEDIFFSQPIFLMSYLPIPLFTLQMIMIKSMLSKP